MKFDGATVYEVVLGGASEAMGVVAIAWSAAAVATPADLLPGTGAGYGLLAGAVGASGLCLLLAGGGVRRYRAVLELGLALLAPAALALIVLGSIEARVGAIASGAALLVLRIALARLEGLALRAGYRPRWFGTRSFRTMVATSETILEGGGREAISPARAAMNTDQLLASIDAPIRSEIRWLFWALEWLLPILILRPIPFSLLGERSRRKLVELLIRPPKGPLGLLRNPFRTVARTLKVLACAGYYGDRATMRAIGFEEFEETRGAHVDRTPFHYHDPNRPPSPGVPEHDPKVPRSANRGPVTVERYDAVIIGSGASGSVMAYQLARNGMSVALLERGRYEDPQTFDQNELSMFPRLYKDGGLQTAADRNTAIFQGSTVGGSTVINNAIWLRPDLDTVLPEWLQRGADVPRRPLEDAYAELEQALHVGLINRQVANPGTGVFLHGFRVSGIPGRLLDNNRAECLGCGWCNYGCRYNRKTSMLVTYVPWGQDRGVDVFDRVADARVLLDGGRAVGVEATREGRPTRWAGKVVVVCAGAIGSSAVLLGSGINPNGQVGRNLHVLGGVFVTGDMASTVNGFAGIGLTCMADPGAPYVLESYFAPPLAFSVRLGGWFESHFERAERYTEFIDGGVMVGTDPAHGKVQLDYKGLPRIELQPSGRDIETLRNGLVAMTDLYFKAGARRVYPSTFRYLDLMPETFERTIRENVTDINDILFGSAHPQGGNVMNANPSQGVVDERFRVHHQEGLFVADTSVWPSNIRANCQATAMAMSSYASTHVLEELGRAV